MLFIEGNEEGNNMTDLPNSKATLRDATKYFRAATEEVVVTADKLRTSINPKEVCEFYQDLYDQLKLIEELTKLLTGIKDDYRKIVIPKLMQGLGMTSMTLDKRQFVRVPELRVSVPEDMVPKCKAWLEEKGYPSVAKETINAQTITSVMREWIDNNGELPPEDTMKIYIGEYVSMKKA